MDYPHRHPESVRTSYPTAIRFSVSGGGPMHQCQGTMCWPCPGDDVGNPYRPFAAAQGDSMRWLRFMCIGGLLWSPVGGACCPFILLTARNMARSHPRRVTVKVTSTGRPASGLCSWLRLMRMRADKSAVGAINRHLRMDGIFCSCAYCFISNGR